MQDYYLTTELHVHFAIVSLHTVRHFCLFPSINNKQKGKMHVSILPKAASLPL